MEKKCILYISAKNGDVYRDSKAIITEIKEHSFTVITLVKGKPRQIKSMNINFFEGNGAHISITGTAVTMCEVKNGFEYQCYFNHSIGANKFLNIHKAKRLPSGKSTKKSVRRKKSNKKRRTNDA